MEAPKSYDLNDSYKLRYFWPNADPTDLLKQVRKWIKSAEGIEVDDININNFFDAQKEVIVFEATVTYLGGSE